MSEDKDEEQMKLMAELCIEVDGNDRVVGYQTKKYCHLMANLNAGKGLHRAFSLFVFNTDNQLLLQQRSEDKITFPNTWTNTVCSHPLKEISEAYSGRSDESEEKDALGVRRAAIRKLHHELGVPVQSLDIHQIKWITRIHYLAASDETWGEHEIDYILVAKLKPGQEFVVTPNPSEVKAINWISRPDLSPFLEGKTNVTPWFKLIVDNFLYKWWDSLIEGSLEAQCDHETIHKMN